MTLDELEQQCPELRGYTQTMPTDIRERCRVRIHPAGSIIHQKNRELSHFGIVARGESRVVNEFENGNVYMIESNKAIDFIGEVTILAEMPRTSVTIEATTEMAVAYMSRADAERWLSQDIEILRKVSQKVAFKLYRSSYSNGAKLFYPPSYLLLDYLVKYAESLGMGGAASPERIVVSKTRRHLQEELGINVKTLNRTISQLKGEGFLDISHGKISLSQDQRLKALAWLETASTK